MKVKGTQTSDMQWLGHICIYTVYVYKVWLSGTNLYLYTVYIQGLAEWNKLIFIYSICTTYIYIGEVLAKWQLLQKQEAINIREQSGYYDIHFQKKSGYCCTQKSEQSTRKSYTVQNTREKKTTL